MVDKFCVLIGIKHFDTFRLRLETGADPGATLAALRRVLDRQSTFYNRNKHLFSLEASWSEDGKSRRHSEGVAHGELVSRWRAELVS